MFNFYYPSWRVSVSVGFPAVCYCSWCMCIDELKLNFFFSVHVLFPCTNGTRRYFQNHIGNGWGYGKSCCIMWNSEQGYYQVIVPIVRSYIDIGFLGYVYIYHAKTNLE